MDKIHIEKLDLYYGDFQALKKNQPEYKSK